MLSLMRGGKFGYYDGDILIRKPVIEFGDKSRHPGALFAIEDMPALIGAEGGFCPMVYTQVKVFYLCEVLPVTGTNPDTSHPCAR